MLNNTEDDLIINEKENNKRNSATYKRAAGIFRANGWKYWKEMGHKIWRKSQRDALNLDNQSVINHRYLLDSWNSPRDQDAGSRRMLHGGKATQEIDRLLETRTSITKSFAINGYKHKTREMKMYNGEQRQDYWRIDHRHYTREK